MLHLRYFVAVAEELSFTRAARRLHMATSPLSRRVRDLERELGGPLFERTSRWVRLTEAGLLLLPEAREVVRRFDGIPELLSGPQAARAAVVGIAPDVSAELRDRLLDELAARRPPLRVTLRPASTAPLVRAVLEASVDLAIVHGPVTERALTQLHLQSHDVVVAVGAGRGFDGRREVRLAELAGLPYASIGYDAAPTLYRRTDRLLRRAGVVERLVVDGHNLAGLTHVVATGQAFTLVSRAGATGRAFTGEPVLLLDVAESRLTISTVAVWSTERAGTDPIVAALAGTLAAVPPLPAGQAGGPAAGPAGSPAPGSGGAG